MTPPDAESARSDLRLVFPPRPTAPGAVDGSWWPRTRDPAVELPVLVAAVTDRISGVDRIALSSDDWDGMALQITSVDDRTVRLDWFSAGDRHAVTLDAGSAHLDLLVIPPDTASVVAVACLAMRPAGPFRPGARRSSGS